MRNERSRYDLIVGNELEFPFLHINGRTIHMFLDALNIIHFLRHFNKASVEQFVRAQRIMSVQCCIDVRETLEQRTDRSVV